MKQIINILIFLILFGCGKLNPGQKTTSVSETLTHSNSEPIPTDTLFNVQQRLTEEMEKEEDFPKQTLIGFQKAALYNLTDSITADFNGDGISDKALFRKDMNSSGIIIKHGKTNEEVKIGFGKRFAHMTDFDWVDYWGLVEDKDTRETTFKDDGDVLGSKNIKLQNPSISLGADEEGGGLITFINGKYLWIHQTF